MARRLLRAAGRTRRPGAVRDLQVPERAQVSSPRRREDPLPQPSYVVLRRPPVNGVPHQDIVRRSVHREVSNLPSDTDGIDQHPLHSSPAHVSAPFEARALRPRYPASYPATAAWRSSHQRCGFLSAFAHRHSLLGHPVPARRIPPFLTVGLPGRRSGPDSVGVPAFRTCEKRPGWVPSLLRDGGVVPAIVTSMTGACRFSTASPLPPLKHPIGGGWDHEAYEDSLAFTRPVFPLPTIPGWNGNGFGFFPGLRTPRSPMTHARAGTALPDTGPGHTLIKSSLQSVSPLLTCDFPRRTVALPAPGDLAAHHLGRARVEVDRLPEPRRRRRTAPTLAGGTCGAQPDQLPGQGSHRLGVHPLVDRLVRHPARLVGGVLDRQPARDRRRGPPVAQLLADHRAQARRALDREQLGPLPPRTRHLVRGRGPVPLTAAVAGDLATDHRPITTESKADLLVLQGLGQTAGDLLAISQHQHLAPRASCPADSARSNATTG